MVIDKAVVMGWIWVDVHRFTEQCVCCIFVSSRWHRVYTKRIHLKRTLLTFPAAPPNQTTAQQLRVLWAGRPERSEVTAGLRRREVTLESPFRSDNILPECSHLTIKDFFIVFDTFKHHLTIYDVSLAFDIILDTLKHVVI